MRRRLLFILAATAALGLVAAATLPWWFGAAVRMAGRGQGLAFQTYERLGYARFALHGADYRRGNVRVEVARLEADTPVLWLWRHVRGADRAVVAGEWSVTVESAAVAPAAPVSPRGWLPLRAQVQRIAAALARWLPRAELGPGRVVFPGGEISAAGATWAKSALAVKGLRYGTREGDATLGFAGDDTVRLAVRGFADGVAGEFLSRAAKITGHAAWHDQRATVEAEFAASGWMPATGTVRAEAWRVPGERLRLADRYAAVTGGAEMVWREGGFTLRAEAASEALAEASAPALTAALSGRGDLDGLTLETVRAELPGLRVILSEPVTVTRRGEWRGVGAKLQLEGDLAAQPWLKATGRVKAEAQVVSPLASAPVLEFSLEAGEIVSEFARFGSIAARGRLAGPRLEIARLALTGEGGEQIEASGGWDFSARTVLPSQVAGTIRRVSVARFLGEQPGFESIELKASAEGPPATLVHAGEAKVVGVTFRGVAPLAIHLGWQGRGPGADRADVRVIAGESVLTVHGAVTRSDLLLNGAEFSQGGAVRLALTAPARVRWQPALHVEPLRFAGESGNLVVEGTYGAAGRIAVSAANVDSRWGADFLPAGGPAWTLPQLALTGAWDRGPAVFSLSAAATVELAPGRTLALQAVARGDADGVRVESLGVQEDETAVVAASGRAPITLTVWPAPALHVSENGDVALTATAAPHAAFWEKLAAVTGVELRDPRASATVSGTWRQPEGRVTFETARLTVDPKRLARPLPTLERLAVSLTGGRSGLILESLTLAVEGQPVRASGRLPVADGRWAELRTRPFETLQKGGEFAVEVPEAELAGFARVLPPVLAPKGRVAIDVAYRDGGFSGFVRLREAATQPLGPLGVLQEISADAELAGRTLTLREVAARSGGQPVTLTGTLELRDEGEPLYDLTLKGENLPFVRRTGLLLRGDLDLALKSAAGSAPRLSGTVRLRDSLFLADVRALLPQGGAGAAQRPPYFHVDTRPLRDWVLAVGIEGAEFLRLRTPVFSGLASARFRLTGTLGEPRAVGEVSVDEGSVTMPFARFEVRQATVRLTEAAPYEPAIFLRGTGRSFSHDLTLEIDGNAAAPNVVFGSSPPLDPDEVLLMVTAGVAPAANGAVTGTQRITRLGSYVGRSLAGAFTEGGDTDRLSISAGEQISRQGRETYAIEYKLTDRWTARGEYDEFDNYNAGLKWRVFQGESPSDPRPEAKIDAGK